MPTEICRHIRLNGSRCKSPSLKGEQLCYFHVSSNHRHRGVSGSTATTAIAHPVSLDGRQLTPIEIQYFTPPKLPLKLDLPPLEDHQSIQLALSLIITAMAEDRIDTRRATSLVYALQVASANAKGIKAPPADYETIRETVLDESGQQIAPDEDPAPSPYHLDYEEFLKNYNEDEEDEEDGEDDEEGDDD